MQFDFANVLVFSGLAVAFVAVMLGVGRLLRPHNPEPLKLTTYECGEPPTGTAWMNFNIRFYLVALVFVIFDVEVAFVYPVAVVYRDWVLNGLGLYALVEIALFLGILFAGLVYVWARGDLAWIKQVAASPPATATARTREAA